MKKILFDLFQAQPALNSKFHGGGEYIKAVFKNLVEKYGDGNEVIVFYDENKFLDSWLIDIIKEKRIKEYFIKNVDDIEEIFKKEKIDIFYSGLPYYYKREVIPEYVRVKGTIHGLRFLELPADCYAYLYGKGKASIKERIRYFGRNLYQEKKRKEFQSCIELVDDLICVSNHTRFSIMNHYPQFKEKEIQVFYTPQKKAELCEEKESPIAGKYVLIMGGDRWIKNCYREVLAFESLFKNGYLENYKIVVVGGLSDKIKAKISDPKRYIIKNYLESDELESLYCFCDFFVYASLNEGFGMPPLEAMKYGTTCVVSGVCSLPEVCGDAVYYVNPYDIEEMAGRILNAVHIKIEPEKVKAQFDRVYLRQRTDLDKLCEFIIDK